MSLPTYDFRINIERRFGGCLTNTRYYAIKKKYKPKTKKEVGFIILLPLADIKTDGERFTFYATFAKTERVDLSVNVM